MMSTRSRISWGKLGLAWISACLALAALAQEASPPKEKAAIAEPGVSESKAKDATPGEKSATPGQYVGAETCKGCHPQQYKVWAGSKHARSFVALQTSTARLISEEPRAYAGIPSPKMMKECTQCHARGMEIPRRERGKDFHPEDGVQCETCHGPGGHYATESVMKDPAERVKAGLVKLQAKDCLQCHKERPTHTILGKPPFDHENFWPKIAHGKKPEGRH
jgi:hypothetical protein